MWRLYPVLGWIWLTVIIAGVAIPTVLGCTVLATEDGCNASRALRSTGPIVVAGLALLATLTLVSWHSFRRHTAEVQFSLAKPVESLRPEDLSFQRAESGDQGDPYRRPHHPMYIPRTAVPFDQLARKNPQPRYSEDGLAAELRCGRSVLLLGQPLEGKSRTLYEVLKRLDSHIVVTPILDRPVPSDDAFRILKGRRTILLLNDLTDLVDRPIDLKLFVEKAAGAAKSLTIAATCRSGSELAAVRESTDPGVRWVYQEMHLRLGLLAPTAKQKGDLVRSLGHEWDVTLAAQFPTLGSIVMEQPMKMMLDRFDCLPAAQQDLLRAMRLLASAGVLPFSHTRVEAVLDSIFDRRPEHLGDCLDRLAAEAFIARPARQDPIDPEPAYLTEAVRYVEGREPEDDFTGLLGVLLELRDVPGVLYLGQAWWLLENDDFALMALDHVTILEPGFPPAWSNKGVVLDRLGQSEAALAAYDEALRLDPVYADAWLNKGTALTGMGRLDEAIAAYDRAIAIEPDSADAWTSKASALMHLGEWPEVVGACDKALQLRPDEPGVLNIKGIALAEIGNLHDALSCLDRARKLEPDLAVAWLHMGAVFAQLGRHLQALDAYNHALEIQPDIPTAWYNKALALLELDEHDEAFLWLCRAWHARDRMLMEDARRVEGTLQSMGRQPAECDRVIEDQAEGNTGEAGDQRRRPPPCPHTALIATVKPRLEARGEGESTVERCDECGWLAEIIYSRRRQISYRNLGYAGGAVEPIVTDASQAIRVRVVPPDISLRFTPGAGLRQELDGETVHTPRTGVPPESYMSDEGVRQIQEWVTQAYFDGQDGWTRDEVVVEVRPAGRRTWTAATDDGHELVVKE